MMNVIHQKIILLHKGVFKNYLNQATRLITTRVLKKTEQVESIKSIIQCEPESNWHDLKSHILCKQGTINEKNVDAVILKVMVTNKKLEAALSFARYLKSSTPDLSIGAVNSLLNLYYEYAKQHDLSDIEKEFIMNTYTNLYNKYKVLDSETSEKLLHALCAISEYKKCLKILDDILLTGTPTHSAYSTLIGTLFKHNKKVEAQKIIDKSLNNRRPLQDYAYDEWLKYIFRKYKDKKVILKYLNEFCDHLSNNCTVVSETTAWRIKECYESINWIVECIEIKKHRGQCKSCNLTLDCLRLSEDEFVKLQQNVKEKLIVGSDLFLKTSPDELKKFMDFVDKTAPYDIVLDALNIAYIFGKGDVNNRIKILTEVVNHFLEQKKKILFLGRKHMLQWRRGSLQSLIKKTHSFFTENISQDDPYFITAAILSGPHTDIVSRDLLRGHRFLLQQEDLRQMFQRWQWEHQWMVFSTKYKPIIQEPLKFTPIAQCNSNSNSWHIPYEPQNTSTYGQVNDGVPDKSSWLCIRRQHNK